jgi:hypothetical protein
MDFDHQVTKGYVQLKGLDDFILVANLQNANIFSNASEAQNS